MHAVSFTASLLLLPILKTQKLIMLTGSYYGKQPYFEFSGLWLKFA